MALNSTELRTLRSMSMEQQARLVSKAGGASQTTAIASLLDQTKAQGGHRDR